MIFAPELDSDYLIYNVLDRFFSLIYCVVSSILIEIKQKTFTKLVDLFFSDKNINSSSSNVKYN